MKELSNQDYLGRFNWPDGALKWNLSCISCLQIGLSPNLFSGLGLQAQSKYNFTSGPEEALLAQFFFV
ncbi:unnamed protein product [Citrullus colocynthis]|uniref:Uncharacterized protein n=1 Tax=Citrullus colocynthis TaxID=252529 RepID=A0ABP0YES6_9ROSI